MNLAKHTQSFLIQKFVASQTLYNNKQKPKQAFGKQAYEKDI